jgi:hypothetical protein
LYDFFRGIFQESDKQIERKLPMNKKIKCQCGTVFNIAPEMAGKKYRCKICSSTINIPHNFFDDNKGINIKPKAADENKSNRFASASSISKKSSENESHASYNYTEKKSQTNTKQIIGILGSVILFIGVFMPIISLPVVGNLNYFQNGKGDGTIVIALAIGSLILVLARQYRGLWLTGFGSLGIMLFTYINFQTKMAQIKSDMESELAGNPFRGLADVAVQSIQLQYGWAVMIVGAAMLIIAAAMKNNPQ